MKTVVLPVGDQVRAGALRDLGSYDFALLLGNGLATGPYRRIDWPDFRVPRDRAETLDALGELRRRPRSGEDVAIGCRGGVGRTGTALAALAVLDGLDPRDAVAWVRAAHHLRAVETPWQRRWLSSVR